MRMCIRRFGRVLGLLVLAAAFVLLTLSACGTFFRSGHKSQGLPPYMTQTFEYLPTGGMAYGEAKAYPLTVMGLGTIALLAGFGAGWLWKGQSEGG